ncbi:MAG: alanine--tRNA ligase [Alphaproteobacteria bacterium]|nr:alanine--tRNA ligase [Alphaproteobacteria bacterium]
MKKLTPQETRETFLDFMESKGHLRISGSSIIPKDDPSLLFINAGMAPMKSYFSGKETPPQSDLCNIQPCIRTIDIEDVGDRHHLTFFEMMGSWSIKNYFKDRAIDLAYELLTERFEFPKEKLYVTVYGGDKEKGIPADEDSIRFWQKTGMPDSHIVVLGEDNFWSAGDTGPCGPCTEIFFDTGDSHGKSYEKTGEFDTQNRYIEIWNAGVFMQYNRREDGTLEKLPFMSVDTGSGLERMVMTLNEKESVYDTESFKPYMDFIVDKMKLTDEDGMASARRVADHIRAATLILSEGVVPGKDGRDYIPRRLIRRSASIAMLRNAPGFSFDTLTKMVIDNMGQAYPKMRINQEAIRQTMAQELMSFQRSVKQGVRQFDKLTRDSDTLTGQQVFDLRSSLGMPLDLISELAKERKISVDMEGYKAEFAKHQMISRNLGGRK